MTDPNPEDVAADDEYVERLRDGQNPDDWVGERLAALRDETQGKQ